MTVAFENKFSEAQVLRALKEVPNMTVLRRMSQLVDDLKKFNVIQENDIIFFKKNDKGEITVDVHFSFLVISGVYYHQPQTFANAVREEFRDMKVEVRNDRGNHCCCTIYPEP